MPVGAPLIQKMIKVTYTQTLKRPLVVFSSKSTLRRLIKLEKDQQPLTALTPPNQEANSSTV